MDLPHAPRLSDLFAQLGLPADSASIENFIHSHHLDQDLSLPQAPWWTPAQAAFLREGWEDDASWAPVIDELNERLRH